MDIAKLLTDEYNEKATVANAAAEKVAAAKSKDSNKAVATLRDKTPLDEVPEQIRPDVQKFRVWRDAAMQKIYEAEEKVNAQVAEHVTSAVNLTPEQIAEETAKHEDARGKANEAKKILKGYLDEAAFKALPKIKSLPRESSGEPGSGAPKPRFESISVNGKDVSAEGTNSKGETKKVVTLTVVANELNKENGGNDKWVKVTAGELFSALKETNGGRELSEATDIELKGFRSGFGENGKGYTIHVFPKKAS